MDVIAETPRLILRRWVMEDVPAVAHIYSDPEVMRFYGGADRFSQAALEESFKAVIAEYGSGYGNYAVVERETGAIVGHCGVRWSEKRTRAELDVALDRSVWRRGYALEAAAGLIAQVFDAGRASEIFGIAESENAASIGLMQRLGMKPLEEIDANGKRSTVYVITKVRSLTP